MVVRPRVSQLMDPCPTRVPVFPLCCGLRPRGSGSAVRGSMEAGYNRVRLYRCARRLPSNPPRHGAVPRGPDSHGGSRRTRKRQQQPCVHELPRVVMPASASETARPHPTSNWPGASAGETLAVAKIFFDPPSGEHAEKFLTGAVRQTLRMRAQLGRTVSTRHSVRSRLKRPWKRCALSGGVGATVAGRERRKRKWPAFDHDEIYSSAQPVPTFSFSLLIGRSVPFGSRSHLGARSMRADTGSSEADVKLEAPRGRQRV
jgi:hypothetical protein